MKLAIASNVRLSDDAVTDTFSIVGQRGSGKTYTAGVMAEGMLDAHTQIVVIDPVGVWWGLKSSADGKADGYGVAIFGGDHAEFPLEAAAGDIIARYVVSSGQSVILDLSRNKKADRKRVVTDFLESLYQHNRTALHLFIDEAHVIAPQKLAANADAAMCAAATEIVTMGRAHGIGCTLITQRPSAVAKDALTQTSALIVGRMNHPLDIRAINDWVSVNATPDEAKAVIASLPTLERGEVWYWHPPTGVLKRARVHEKKTFDSSRTPKPGERRKAPKAISKVDRSKLSAEIAAMVEKRRADDPATLRARIAELEKQAAKPAAARPSFADVSGLVAGDREKLIKAAITKRDREWKTAIAPLQAWAVKMRKQTLDNVKRAGDLLIATGDVLKAEAPAVEVPAGGDTTLIAVDPGNPKAIAIAEPGRPVAVWKPGSDYAASTNGNGALTGGKRKILTAVVQFGECSPEQIGVLTDYKATSRGEYIKLLAAAGYVERLPGGNVRATAAGVEALGPVEPLPTGEALQSYWLGRLTPGESGILKVALAAYPESVAIADVGEAVGLKATSTGEYAKRLAARKLITRDRGAITASAHLFD